MALTEIAIRLVIALIFGGLSIVFLSFGSFIAKKDVDVKKSGIASIIFALLLFSFSFFPNTLFSVLTAVAMLIIVKYLYVFSWKETLMVWAIWMLIWIVLFSIIAGAIYVFEPFSSPI